MKKGEKVMDRLQSQKENKAGILEDMLSFIRYTPNREADILAFMEKYQKADHEERPAILGHLRCCMDGKEYPNPYACLLYTSSAVPWAPAYLEACQPLQTPL